MGADGMVSYREFVTQLFAAVQDPRVANVGGAFLEHFQEYDREAELRWKQLAKELRANGFGLREAFALFDRDGDGAISCEDMQRALRSMNSELTQGEIERLVRCADGNRDGRINYHEFVDKLM